MPTFITALADSVFLTPEYFVLLGVGAGVLLGFYGIVAAFAGPSDEVRRLRAGRRDPSADSALLSHSDTDPRGIFKVFVPGSREERTKIAMKMRQAGIYRPGSVRNFYLARGLFGLILPSIVVALLFLPRDLPFRPEIGFLNDLSWMQSFQLVTALLIVGFYGPSFWLKSRIDSRRAEIEQGMPNALDLLQVSVEAGMGFDAAMNRVAHEIARVVPPIAEEFMTVQLEIQAGKDRERAFLSMAERTGVEEMSAFVNVILQSAQFGSSISGALSTYATEMRSPVS